MPTGGNKCCLTLFGNWMTKIAFQSPVTNAPFASLHRLIVGPVSLTTTPVPFRKKRARHERHRVVSKDRRASACGSPTVVSLRLRSCVSPPSLHFPVRRTAGRSLAKIHLNRSSRFILRLSAPKKYQRVCESEIVTNA
jgi:hypothetical protein